MISKFRLYDSIVRVIYVCVRCYFSLKVIVYFGWKIDVEINMIGVCVNSCNCGLVICISFIN